MKPNLPVLAVIAVAAATVLTACSSQEHSSSSSRTRTSTISVPSSTTQATVTTTSVSVAPSTAGFEASSKRLRGTADNGSTWDLHVPQVTGGTGPARKAYNDALTAAAERIVTGARAEAKVAVTDGELSDGERSRAVVARTTLSGVLVTLGAAEGAAYPSHNVETVVLNPGSNQVLPLDSIFTDPAAARAQLVTLAMTADASGRLAGTTVDAGSLNAWIALDEGLHLYVPVIHAMGDYVPATIPWAQLSVLLNPTGQVLFASH